MPEQPLVYQKRRQHAMLRKGALAACAPGKQAEARAAQPPPARPARPPRPLARYRTGCVQASPS